MKKHILRLLPLLLAGSLLTACNNEPVEPSGTETDPAGSVTVADTVDGPDTPAESEEESEPAPETPAETGAVTDPGTDEETQPDSETETETETEPVIKLDGIRLDQNRLKSTLSGSNMVEAERVELDGEGAVLKLSSNAVGNDPHIVFDFKTYCKMAKVDPFQAENYEYVLLRVKNEGCSNGTFELFYYAGETAGVTGSQVVTSTFDNSTDGWQYILFDFRSAPGWQGTVNGFRFDFQPSFASVGETLYISDILFAKNTEEMNALLRSDMEDPFLYETDPAVESKVEALLATPDKAPATDNTKLDAAHEDANLDLWFNHAITKTPAEDITSTGWNSYTLRMAKNEAEGVHLLLASKTGHNGITVSVTDFVNAAGVTLKTELMYGYYFDDVDGKTVVDPIPWVKDGQTFDLAADRSYMYIIKATTAIDSPAGAYSATVTVKDADGKEIKKAVVTAQVWNFALPEETSCKTQMDLSWYNIYMSHECYEGDDSLLYKNYYDLLLSNRVCAYTLPYATKGTFSDSRVLEYLNNPRVTAFNPIDWKNHSYNDDTIKAAYAFLSQKQEWLDKSYFYIVDEPGNKEALDRINQAGAQLKEHFPGYKMMAPMHLNYALNGDCTEDYISYIQDSINVWCYKPYFYTTYEQFCYDRSLAYRMSAGIEEKLGTFGERMEKEQAEGDELWWYVTRRPENPEITLLMDTESVRHRILFWQQKLYNVDSFLYYLVNDWYEIGENNGLNKKHETQSGMDAFDCYGNGVLLYCGQDFDVYGGVESIRLENVRDGIEDFEYLTILQNLYGKDVTDALIRRLATSISRYNTDIDNFNELRVALGNIIEEALAAEGKN